MSDENDFWTERLMDRLVRYYLGIHKAFKALPIPIELPVQQVGLYADLLPAVIQAYKILDEEPISQHDMATATTVALYWIAGCELTVAYAASHEAHRADAAMLQLMAGEGHLGDLLMAARNGYQDPNPDA
ncbi:hypothetical protein ABZ883_04900 [Streptomyces sp. NPDC046977]|uniref:hypothetical protein n=1 Tax=Streptomyces sp. NPDC046977 TaxID=3154703 RepID=UPI0033CB201E